MYGVRRKSFLNCQLAVSEFVVALAMKIMKVPRCDKLPSLFSKGILFKVFVI